jgi:hypothetical protein
MDAPFTIFPSAAIANRAMAGFTSRKLRTGRIAKAHRLLQPTIDGVAPRRFRNDPFQRRSTSTREKFVMAGKAKKSKKTVKARKVAKRKVKKARPAKKAKNPAGAKAAKARKAKKKAAEILAIENFAYGPGNFVQ